MLVFSLWGSILGLLIGLASSVIVLWQPQIAKVPYRLWSRVADFYVRVARLAVKVICFFLVFVTVRRGGSSLTVSRAAFTQSMWLERGTVSRTNYAHEYEGTSQESSASTWTTTFVSWAKESGNFWAITLLPFLMLLSALEADEECAFPPNIYTLF